LYAVVDALGMGIGYTWVLVGIAAFRELLGNGTILSVQIMPASFEPILFFTLSPGGFMVFALFISFNIWLKNTLDARSARLAAAKEAA
jgi:Na+-translocating ferredoxin:NAD+ oxidoreductase subunit E